MIEVLYTLILTEYNKPAKLYHRSGILTALPGKGDYISILGKDGKYVELEIYKVIHSDRSPLIELRLTIGETFNDQDEVAMFLSNIDFKSD